MTHGHGRIMYACGIHVIAQCRCMSHQHTTTTKTPCPECRAMSFEQRLWGRLQNVNSNERAWEIIREEMRARDELLGLGPTLKELREWHKSEYHSNQEIDARVDEALARWEAQNRG